MCVNIYRKMSIPCSPWTLRVGSSIDWLFVLMLCVAASFDNVNRISETFSVIDGNNDDNIYDDDDDV